MCSGKIHLVVCTCHYRMLTIFIGQPDLGTHIYEALMFKARSNIMSNLLVPEIVL